MQTMMNVVELNNTGACFLDSGDYQHAAIDLVEGIRSYKELVLAFQQVDNNELSFLGENGIDSMMEKSRCLRLREYGEDNWGKAGAYIYMQPIHIPIDNSRTAEFCNGGVITILASLMFNLALSRHLLAIASERNSEALLRKAAHLYEFGLSLHGRGTGLWNFFAVVSLNNLGTVYRSLEESETSERYFSELLFATSQLTRSEGNPASDGSIYNAFYTSAVQVLVFQKLGVKVSAAAA
jgi:tetratricopeptide (TPR) repeat protein